MMTAVDMVSHGDMGLATSDSSALILLTCNSVISPCNSCISVTGPGQTVIQLLDNVEQSAASYTYSMHISWDTNFTGSVAVSIDSQR